MRSAVTVSPGRTFRPRWSTTSSLMDPTTTTDLDSAELMGAWCHGQFWSHLVAPASGGQDGVIRLFPRSGRAGCSWRAPDVVGGDEPATLAAQEFAWLSCSWSFPARGRSGWRTAAIIRPAT